MTSKPYTCCVYKKYSNDPILVTIFSETEKYYLVSRVDPCANWDLPTVYEKLYKSEWSRKAPEPIKPTKGGQPSYVDFLNADPDDP